MEGLEAGEKCSFMKHYRHQLPHKRFVSATTCHNTFSFLPQFDQKNGLNPDLKKPLESKLFVFLRERLSKTNQFRPHLNTRKIVWATFCHRNYARSPQIYRTFFMNEHVSPASRPPPRAYATCKQHKSRFSRRWAPFYEIWRNRKGIKGIPDGGIT